MAGGPAAAPPANAVTEAAGFSAATTGVRSSSVDHRITCILTGLPGSLTFADVAVSFTSPVSGLAPDGAAKSTDNNPSINAKPRVIGSGSSL
jgi:hypothetical protein